MLSASLLWYSFNSFGQLMEAEQPLLEKDAIAERYARTITEADLQDYLNILASDALEGRETGTRGQKMAAAFIEQHFVDNDLSAVVQGNEDWGYQQRFDLYKNHYRDIYLSRGNRRWIHQEDLLFYGDVNLPEETTINLRFVGQGELENYQDMDVKDHMVVFYADSRTDRSRKVKIAQDQGARGFFIINTDSKEAFDQYLKEYGKYFVQSSIDREAAEAGDVMMFFGHPQLAAELLDTKLEMLNSTMQKNSSKNPLRKIKPATIGVKAQKMSVEITTENVLGFIEGTDKKDELVVITAHYDHEGVDGEDIYNGADDDGSGTVAVLEIAQAFAEAKSDGHGPRRSMLFMAVTGEEKGLLGSSFYVDNPVFPLENTVANLNIDMIGRVDKKHHDQPAYVYVIGADRLSPQLHDINEGVNALYTHMQLDYTYNAPDDPNRFYYRSDHYNFAKHNIPIIFYFNGTHEDYHRPTDTIEKIRFDILKKRTELIYYTAWELVNQEERLKLK